MPKDRPARVAKTASPYARSEAEKEAFRRGEAAHRNPRETRRNQGPLVQGAVDPQIPAVLWKGDRPSWNKDIALLRAEVVARAGTNLCRKAGCNVVGDEIDHKVDWRTHIYNKLDFVTIDVPGGEWEGFLLEEVKDVYNDINNLQMMCGHHNGSKSGPKFYDKDRPTFTRN